ncbi:unnamed protein product [Allacma fusca]|uniref:Uncharacterized protein n=1 Tax=Allacma fusca TaxID=39272 RepID=A0A8J2KLV7_9HEXA|nr:unnamed protein product [Allacma fusca]
MAWISYNLDRWLSEDYGDVSALWQQLDIFRRRLIHRVDRFWISTVIRGNRRHVMDIFRLIIGHVMFADVTPVLASTPKTKGQKFCI